MPTDQSVPASFQWPPTLRIMATIVAVQGYCKGACKLYIPWVIHYFTNFGGWVAL